MGKGSEVPVAERREVVLSLLRREDSAAVIARRVGDTRKAAWHKRYLAGDLAAA